MRKLKLSKNSGKELKLPLSQLFYLEIKEFLGYEVISTQRDAQASIIDGLENFPVFIDVTIFPVNEIEAWTMVNYLIPTGINKYNNYKKELVKEIRNRKDLFLVPAKKFNIPGVTFIAKHKGVTLGDIIMDTKKIVLEMICPRLVYQ